MKTKWLLLLMFVCVNAFAKAQTDSLAFGDSAKYENKYYDELIAVYKSRIDSLSKANDSLKIQVNNASTYKLFVPLTFYHSPAQNSLSLDSKANNVTSAVDNALINMYISRPDLVKGTETQLKKTGSVRDDIDKPLKQEKILVEKAVPVPQAPVPDVQASIVVKKPNFWKFSANSKFQLLQYYYSDNWHKGGESNYSMFGELILKANYNNKQKVKFDNELVMQLGFRNSREDTLHKFKTSTDVIRYTGKLGLQATKRWYYSLQLIATTQFTQGLRSNDKKVYSDFLSPLNVNLGVGMDYSVATKDNKLTGNINMSALAFNFKYVDRKNLASNHGIKGNHRTNEDFGSSLNANLTWKISNSVSWRTRLYAYTSYKRALVEWENTFKLQVSKYISANLVVYPRFDDSTKRHDDMGYLQFQEYSSLGFEYSF